MGVEVALIALSIVMTKHLEQQLKEKEFSLTHSLRLWSILV